MSEYVVEVEELEDGGALLHILVPKEDIIFWVEKGLMSIIMEAAYREKLETFFEEEEINDTFLDYWDDELGDFTEEEVEVENEYWGENL